MGTKTTSLRKVGDGAVFPDTKEVTPSGYVEDVRLWETPYKHEVRHAVKDEAHTNSHLGEVRSVKIADKAPAKSLGVAS